MQRLQERDLRSLERASMYSIFGPLDPNEALPRELLLEAKRYRQVGRRELAGALWLPAVVLVMVAGAWKELDGGEALGALALVFLGLVAFALSDERRSRH